MKWVSIDGVSLRYDVSGDGPRTLVLIHEMGGSLESWDGVIAGLRPGWRIVRYDWRGMGMSQKIVGGITIQDHSNDLAGLLSYLGVDGPVCLSGCAVGGAIALYYAGTYPERASGVVAMCPATEVNADKRAANLKRADVLDREGLTPEVIGGLNNSYPPEVRHDPETYRNYLARFGSNDGRSYAATTRMLADLDMRAELRSITCPTLLLAGVHDRARPMEMVEAVSRLIPGAAFKTLNSGHFMLVHTPEMIAGEIDRFLA